MGTVVVELEGQLLKMGEQVLTDIVDDVLAHGYHVFASGPAEHDGGYNRRQHTDAEEHKLLPVFIGHGHVYASLYQQGAHQGRRRGDSGIYEGERHLFLVPANVGASPQKVLYIKRSF